MYCKYYQLLLFAIIFIMKAARLDFSEGIQSSQCIYNFSIKKYIGKRLPQLFYVKMKICLELCYSLTSEFP